MNKCVVCYSEVSKKELDKLADEFKQYPAHSECFDTFETADEFLKYAKNHKQCEHCIALLDKNGDCKYCDGEFYQDWL